VYTVGILGWGFAVKINKGFKWVRKIKYILSLRKA
jgi:hypothetical protein